MRRSRGNGRKVPSRYQDALKHRARRFWLLTGLVFGGFALLFYFVASIVARSIPIG